MFQLVVVPLVLARPEAQHGYGPKCRTVYKTQYKAGVIKLASVASILTKSDSLVTNVISTGCYISPIYVVEGE